jgi:hypothetical protein
MSQAGERNGTQRHQVKELQGRGAYEAFKGDKQLAVESTDHLEGEIARGLGRTCPVVTIAKRAAE